jgi:hypothetical protein
LLTGPFHGIHGSVFKMAGIRLGRNAMKTEALKVGRWIVLASSLSGVTSNLFGQEFQVLGLRQLGMGGAGVANTDGALSQYWNPGNLAFQKRVDLEVPVGARVEATGDILNKASDISNFASQIQQLQNLQSSNGSINLQQVNDFYAAVNKINALNQDGSGALVGADGGGNLQIGHLAVSVNNFTEVGATPFADTNFNLGSLTNGTVSIPTTNNGTPSDPTLAAASTQLAGVISNLQHGFGVNLNGATAQQAANQIVNTASAGGLSDSQITSLVQQAQAGQTQLANAGITGGSGSFDNNQSNVTLRGASLTEATVGYGLLVPIPSFLGNLGLGANFKLVRGQVGYEQVMLANGQTVNASEAMRDFVNNSKIEVKPAVDVGAQWKTPLPMNTRLGLLARNLNSPTFDQPGVGAAAGEPAFKDDLQARAGVALQPLSLLSLAGDVDLSKNATSVPGYSSRNVGAGAEINLWLLKLRAGLMKDVEGGTPLVYTAGIGLRLFMVSLDIGGAVSSKTVTFSDGTRAPSVIQVGAQFSLLFGR